MRQQIEQVKDFHKAFGIPYSNSLTMNISRKLIDLRVRLIQEETNEYLEAAYKQDLIEVIDALTDSLYVLLGTFVTHGLIDVAEAVFNEVHNSNMSKLSKDGKAVLRQDGKVIKGPNFFKPDIPGVLKTWLLE